MVVVGTILVTGSVAALVLHSSSLPVSEIQSALGEPAPGRTGQPRDAAPTVPRSDILTLSFVGDIMAHRVNFTHPPYDAIYRAVAPVIRRADISFANLEFVVDPKLPYAGYPWFNVHPEYVEAAIGAGFRAFSIANNHIYDYGAGGVRESYLALDSLRKRDGIVFSGIHPNGQSGLVPETIQRKGWRIGFLAITEFLNRYLRSEQVNVVNFDNPIERTSFLAKLKGMAAGYDLFILSVHGGDEYALRPNPAKEAFFRQAVRAGVTIVWGQHPHVLQPWELETVDGAQRLIINSAGNFISGQTESIDPAAPATPRANTGDSAIFRVTVRREQGRANVVSVDPLLISNRKTEDGQMVVEPLNELVRMPLSPSWHDYYTYRLRVAQSLSYGERVLADGSRYPVVAPLEAGVSAVEVIH